MAEAREASRNDLVFLEANGSFVPKDTACGLTFTKCSHFLLINDIPHRKGVYFAQSIAGRYGFIPIKKMKKRTKIDWLQRDRLIRSIEAQTTKTHQRTLDQNVCIAIDNYIPSPAFASTELRVQKDDVIKIIERRSDGWFFGASNGERGWFPQHYAKESFKMEGSLPLLYQFTVEAKNSFLSTTSDELRFSAKERLDIIQRPTAADSVWVARNRDGKMGLIQKSRVDEKPDKDTVLFYWPWYHSPCTRQAAENILKPMKSFANHFLVRDSESYPGSFTICATTGVDGRILHLVVQTTMVGYKINELVFESLTELITYHKTHAIFDSAPGQSDGYQIFLLHYESRLIL